QRVAVMPATLLGLIIGGVVAFRMTRRSLPGPITDGALSSIGWSPATTRDLLLAAVVGAAIAFLYLFGLVPASPPSSTQHWGPLTTAATSGGWPRHLWAVVVLLAAPPVEEFVFRGVLLAGIRQSWTPTAAGAAVTLVFVLLHFGEIAGYWPAIVGLTLLGAATVIARIVTGSLAPAVALHASYNLGLVVVLYATG
ncbi:MAG TPA: CPBP family intramembrane glutamic endopeptidase, partial [Vicinamibacteria bacterium]|nr:CPBP family intramembrane glutamic endopeptidase [Vicinamibacteria bacterium]